MTRSEQVYRAAFAAQLRPTELVDELAPNRLGLTVNQREWVSPTQPTF